MSRLHHTTRNFIWSTLSNFIMLGIQLISRTFFISILGMEYLGVNSLFINIITILSFTELGIGTAINYSLYKPLAKNDIEKIKSLMQFYKLAYRYISIAIVLLGLLFIPFIGVLIQGGESVDYIIWIYLIFLFSTTSSYLFTYKRTILFADQKSYLMININMIVSIITLIIQLLALIIFKNYIIYLILAVIVGIGQNIYINKYINKKYPYLLDKQVQKLSREDTEQIKVNVKAMILHKIGDLSINQTDNLIISSFINVTFVGLVSNYTLLINGINQFILGLMNSVSASLGNLIATENEERQLRIFNVYNFLAFLVFGWASVCIYILMNPFITLWLGVGNIISQGVINLIIINFYLTGMRVPLGNIKAAAGVYSQDKYVPLIQSVVNLVISIVSVKYLGLAGVFLGTVSSSLVMPCWYRPIVVYKYVFKSTVKPYFSRYMMYILVVLFNAGVTSFISGLIFSEGITIGAFAIMSAICLVLPNIITFVAFRKTEELEYIKDIINSIIRKVVNRWKIRLSA